MSSTLRILTVLSLLGSISAFSEEPTSQPTHEVVEQLEVMVALSDGVKLATNILLPDGEGPWPTILVRTPYNKDGPTRGGRYFAKRGYAYVIQDTRGRFDSEGAFNPLMTEGKDGYEAQDWVASQPWCSGRIGTVGGSYVGLTQWLPAPRKHAAVKAMLPIVTTSNLYEVVYHDGALELATLGLWAMQVTDPPGFRLASRGVDAALRTLPLTRLDVGATGRKIPFLRDWIAHPTPGAYWDPAIVDDEYSKIEIPVLNVGGWYDIFAPETVKNYAGVTRDAKTKATRCTQRLIMGPWGHSIWRARSGKIGEMDFGGHSFVPMNQLQLRWFDTTLKGMDNGIMEEPPVRIFVMGENQWRDENEWPLARTQPTAYYLHSLKAANTRGGDGELVEAAPDSSVQDIFVYDPRDPVPTRGGAVLGIPYGPFDQRETEERDDVLVYSTPVLHSAVEVTGHVKLVLYAASSAPNTDFTGKLVDVHSTGYAQNLCDGIVRATHRESDTDLSAIEPGRIYRYEIDLGVTSNLFHAGHRIRLEVSSSNFPRFDRNPNTGHPWGADAEMVTATQTVYHEKEYPSHLLLPIIPR